PKRENNILESMKLNKPYYQVFTNKQGFVKNLSILDLLFNEGPNSISYLESYTKGQE
ncbi:MAG: WbqC family protein, partial [Bacteroidales bacterium]|nr:WbqC family protein [Bacteroidales bacterium]